MGKMIVYKCDNCDFNSEYAQDLIISEYEIYNGENEVIYSGDSSKMICYNCLQYGIINKKKDNISIRNLIKSTSDAKKSSAYQKTINEITGKLNEKETNQIENNDESSLLQTEIESTEELINEMESDSNELEKDQHVDELVPNKEDVNYKYVSLKYIDNKEDEDYVLQQLGFNDISDFKKKTGIFTLKNCYLPIDMYTDEITEEYQIQTHPVIVDFINSIPVVKLVTVMIDPKNIKEGYIEKVLLIEAKEQKDE